MTEFLAWVSHKDHFWGLIMFMCVVFWGLTEIIEAWRAK